ncbi:MAG: Hsp20/alpha crystallin family protein [Syntrophaceae bacterium]|nr:Hsp20/alpha crystallin family protein [Syntrophaceae bacterium]
MPIRRLLPSLRGEPAVPAGKENVHPFSVLQQEMNRIFEDFFQGTALSTFPASGEHVGSFYPSVDVKEGEKEIVVHAELPGMEEKDVDLLLEESSLVLKGEKKFEKEDKGEGYHTIERSYGSFRRVIPLPREIDLNKTQARFKNGVLTVTLPKKEQAKAKGKKIPIQSA